MKISPVRQKRSNWIVYYTWIAKYIWNAKVENWGGLILRIKILSLNKPNRFNKFSLEKYERRGFYIGIRSVKRRNFCFFDHARCADGIVKSKITRIQSEKSGRRSRKQYDDNIKEWMNLSVIDGEGVTVDSVNGGEWWKMRRVTRKAMIDDEWSENKHSVRGTWRILTLFNSQKQRR